MPTHPQSCRAQLPIAKSTNTETIKMSKIEIKDLPKDKRISKREMATVTGGFQGGVYVVNAKLKALLWADLHKNA